MLCGKCDKITQKHTVVLKNNRLKLSESVLEYSFISIKCGIKIKGYPCDYILPKKYQANQVIKNLFDWPSIILLIGRAKP